MKEKNKTIVTAPDTMLGRYLLAELERHPLADTLIHNGGTDEDADAMALNLDATRRLLDELETDPPRNIVYVSTLQVYSRDAGLAVDETRPTFAATEAGRSKARTELLLEKWCAARGVMLTIVRPAWMFGTGVDGYMLRLFNRVIRGHYVHIRGNDSKVSLVTALDAARAILALAGKPGIFNISDGRPHTWLSLVEAMSANTGALKRMTHLPEKWASVIYRWLRWVPIVEETLSDEALDPVSHNLLLDNERVRRATGIEFFDTVEVIARRSKTYPYETR